MNKNERITIIAIFVIALIVGIFIITYFEYNNSNNVIYVSASALVITAMFSYFSFRHSNSQMEISKKIYVPYVSAGLVLCGEECGKNSIQLKIQNTGSRLAENVEIKINPEFTENHKSIFNSHNNYLKKLSASKFSIGVNHSFHIPVCYTDEMNCDTEMVIVITYSFGEETHLTTQVLDLSQYHWISSESMKYSDSSENKNI